MAKDQPIWKIARRSWPREVEQQVSRMTPAQLDAEFERHGRLHLARGRGLACGIEASDYFDTSGAAQSTFRLEMAREDSDVCPVCAEALIAADTKATPEPPHG